MKHNKILVHLIDPIRREVTSHLVHKNDDLRIADLIHALPKDVEIMSIWEPTRHLIFADRLRDKHPQTQGFEISQDVTSFQFRGRAVISGLQGLGMTDSEMTLSELYDRIQWITKVGDQITIKDGGDHEPQ